VEQSTVFGQWYAGHVKADTGRRVASGPLHPAPKNGSEAKNHFDWELMHYTHLFLTNRGLLITPFHNMILLPPVATEADIDLLINGWDDCLAEIAELGRR